MTGEKAVRHLKEAKNVITTYYNHPYVQEKAPQIKKDNEGNPYDFEVEMLRDRAKYCLTAAAITGDASFRIAAMDFLDLAIISASPEEETAEGLAWMEYGIVRKDFAVVPDGYEETYSKSVTIGNLDRARWAARTLFGESLKRGLIVTSIKALIDLAKVRNPVKILLDGGIGIFRSLPIHRLQRATLPKGFNSESLEIS